METTESGGGWDGVTEPASGWGLPDRLTQVRLLLIGGDGVRGRGAPHSPGAVGIDGARARPHPHPRPTVNTHRTCVFTGQPSGWLAPLPCAAAAAGLELRADHGEQVWFISHFNPIVISNYYFHIDQCVCVIVPSVACVRVRVRVCMCVCACACVCVSGLCAWGRGAKAWGCSPRTATT